MIDKSAFRDLSYGLYIVSSMKGQYLRSGNLGPATSEHRDQQG